MSKKSVSGMLVLLVVVTVSSASAGIIYYDDSSTVTSDWYFNGTSSLTSDGNVLNLQGSNNGDYAGLNFGFADPVNELTMVFDFKVTSPGDFTGIYLYSPSEGFYMFPSLDVKSSFNGAAFTSISTDTWYTAAIYNNGVTGWQKFWMVEGKQADLSTATCAYEVSTPTWTTCDHAVFFAYSGANLQYDNIRINSGLDVSVPEPVSLVMLVIGGITLIRRK